MAAGEFKCMSDLHGSHKQFSFPQDGTHTTFSSTCIYWRPKPEASLIATDQASGKAAGKNDDAERTAETIDEKPQQGTKKGNAEEDLARAHEAG